MTLRENVPLASLTTLRVGGIARVVAECRNTEDVAEALAYARTHALPHVVLGEGSNVLASDTGYDGLVLLMRDESSAYDEHPGFVRVTLGAGYSWDRFVEDVAQRGLWGIENLAGIPGTVGAAPVQNIGAYGVEVESSIVSVSVLNAATGEYLSLPRAECAFGYRDSRFKRERELIILAVTFELQRTGTPHTHYADVARYEEAQGKLVTPLAIGQAVREIRSKKFPDLSLCGTAGSFFKNPTITVAEYEALRARYPELTGFPMATGVKVPLAFVLDRILSLRGYRIGPVRLFEQQPLVLVADIDSATSAAIDVLADDVAQRVHDAIGVAIEREVQTIPRK